MKDFLIVYFSRTGNCERAAKSLAQALELNVCPIAANENWNGLPGILRYSLYKITKKQAAVTLDKRMLDAKRLILVSPLWDAQLALPVQTALLQWENKEIYLLTSSKQSHLHETQRFKAVFGIQDDADNSSVLSAFISLIKSEIEVSP